LAGVVAATALLAGPAWSQDKASQKFLTEAIQGNLAEVQMGQLAQKNGTSDAVKQYGKMLEDDHGAANEKAMAAAKQMNVTAPTAPTAKQKADYDRMAKMTGAKFDQQFAKDMVKDHQKDLKAYQTESSKNDAAGQYAKETLPTLQKHLQQAQALTPSPTTGKAKR
jgi:putative membrane protein